MVGVAVILQSYVRGGASRVTVAVPPSMTTPSRGPPLIARSKAMLTPRAFAVSRASGIIVGMDWPSTRLASAGPIGQGRPAPRAMSRPWTRLSLSIRPVAAASVSVSSFPSQGAETGVSGARPSVTRRNIALRSVMKSPRRARSSPLKRPTEVAFMAAIRSPSGPSPGGRRLSHSTDSSVKSTE